MQNVYELIPSDCHKSFYRKAVVILAGKNKVLLSYGTPVAYLDKNGNFHRTWEGWSATTSRHVKAFGGPNKAGWMKLPVEPVPNY